MDESSWKNLKSTLRRVEKAVNTRFEKDTDLYIAKEDLEWLKKKLHEGNYELVANRLKTGLKAEALTRVIIENAWLLPNNRYGPLLAVIKECPSGYMGRGGMMTGILQDKYDMPKDFRDKAAEICFAEMDERTAEAMLQQGAAVSPILHNATLCLRCLNSSLTSLPPLEKYRRFTDYAKDKAEFYAYTQWRVLDDIFSDGVLTDEVLDAAFRANFLTDGTAGYKYWRYVFEKRCQPQALIHRVEQVFNANSGNEALCRKLWYSIAPIIKTDAFAESFFAVLRRVAPVWHRHRLDRLGEKVVNKLQDINTEFAKTAAQICQEAGINAQVAETDNLPDVDAIVETLQNEALSDADLRRMAKAFNDKYWKNHQIEHLEEIRTQLDEEGEEYYNFTGFCGFLAERNPGYPPYLLYVIRHFADDEKIVEWMLEVIKNNNLLHHPNLKKFPHEWKEAADFVKEHDFALFKKLTS